uniref:Uncharacterized protein n=1 Tax=Arundo donax TaxID=35708 RepID=A0A0A9BML8_ARUDO
MGAEEVSASSTASSFGSNLSTARSVAWLSSSSSSSTAARCSGRPRMPDLARAATRSSRRRRLVVTGGGGAELAEAGRSSHRPHGGGRRRRGALHGPTTPGCEVRRQRHGARRGGAELSWSDGT